MKLNDRWFEAEFVGAISDQGSFRRLPSIEGAQAVFLWCPCAFGNDARAHGLIVPFANPRNAPSVPAAFQPAPRWQMTGTGLDDLTLSPSIDCTRENPEHTAARLAVGLKPGECSPGHMCWHGWIQNGEVR